MKVSILVLSIFISLNISFAQSYEMDVLEDQLVVLLDDLRSAQNNQEKEEKNEIFKAKMKRVLERKEALTYPFSKLSTVGFIDSPDGLVRIINWNVEQDDLSQKYFGFVIHTDKRKKKYYSTELVEDPFGLPEPSEILTPDRWYGALYYQIIPVKKGSRTVYTVLGWDGGTTYSTTKLVDAMYITGKNVKFGTPIFKINGELKNRLFYEHADKVTMWLHYEHDRKRIMMDHLSPESPSMKGFREFYVPDLSYDALKFEGSKWILHEDVIGVNKATNEKQTILVRDPKSGQLVEKEIENEWENPSDPHAPAGPNNHVATTPESANGEEPLKKEKNKKSNEPAYNKKDKRDPSNLSMYKDIKKRKRRKTKKR